MHHAPYFFKNMILFFEFSIMSFVRADDYISSKLSDFVNIKY
jgi:hypothetical protein